MQRIISDPQDAPGNSAAENMRAATRDSANAFQKPPTPRELYFETGIVLAIALSAGMLVQLVMGSP
jgi:hypothetical protein